MAERPALARCLPAPSEVGSSGSGDSSESGAECVAVAGPDLACPLQTPYCDDGACQGCDVFAEEFCAAVDPGLPVCDDGSKRCVECTPAEPLCAAATPFCASDRVCRGCWKHEQCPDSACDLHTGTCMPVTAVAWVDGSACPGPGTGSENDPFCEIDSALALPGDVLTVWVRGSSVLAEQVIVGERRTVAIRAQSGRPRLSAGSFVINASSGARLLVAGIDVLGGDPAINCAGAELWLEDVVVHSSPGDGIVASNCELHVGRSQIIDRDGHAIELRGRSALELSSSILGLNGTPDASTHAIWVRDESTASIVYSTLAANRGMQPSASLACEQTASAELRSSIAVALNGDSIDCTELMATGNVVDVAVPGEANVEVAALSPVWFADLPGGDFHVADPVETPFGGLAVWQGGDPYEDVDGEPRGPTEAMMDVVGADAP